MPIVVSVHLWGAENVGRSSPGSLLRSGFLGSADQPIPIRESY